jgi:glutaryl-CoA dehydrogenase
LPARPEPYLGTGLLPADFYAYEELLPDEDRKKIERVRDFLRTEAAPIVDDYWGRAEFPFQLVDGFARLGLLDWADPESTEAAPSNLMIGLLAMEIAHADASLSTFFGVHAGLGMGSVIACGSDEQKRRWLPAMSRFEKIGAFGLTEPHGGSDVAGGMQTTAQRDGDSWILNGTKRWIGNATFADLVVIWARDAESGHVLGFVVEKGTPGFRPTKIENKMALRIVQNADIVLDGCRVSEANRLQRANGFKDTAKILRATRSGVAWQSVGVMFGAYEIALQYAKDREQFGRPIGSFQAIQHQCANMLVEVESSKSITYYAGWAVANDVPDAPLAAAMAKAYCSDAYRHTAGEGIQIHGGIGFTWEHDMHLYFKRAKSSEVTFGDATWNRELVARHINL